MTDSKKVDFSVFSISYGQICSILPKLIKELVRKHKEGFNLFKEINHDPKKSEQASNLIKKNRCFKRRH